MKLFGLSAICLAVSMVCVGASAQPGPSIIGSGAQGFCAKYLETRIQPQPADAQKGTWLNACVALVPTQDNCVMANGYQTIEDRLKDPSNKNKPTDLQVAAQRQCMETFKQALNNLPR